MTNEKKTNQDEVNVKCGDAMAGEDNSGIKMVIMRLLSDDEFKQELVEDPDTALDGYELTEVQKILIKSLSPEDLDKLTPDNIQEYFSADAAVYTPDEGASLDEFETFEDDDLLE